MRRPATHENALARKLRHAPTDAETALWWRLRAGQMEGLRFRRQQPIGDYVVDFICARARVVIEVDGSQHTPDSERERRRTAFLEGSGYTVVRLWNNEVLANLDGVIEAIRTTITSPSPQSSPSSGEDVIIPSPHEGEG